MFDEGEVGWPENPPFRAPVFVVTHQAREPWVRKGGTTFFFVTSGIESALSRPKAAAGGKDVRISGGAETIQQFIRAGLIDEFDIDLAPVLLGDGVRLFSRLAPGDLSADKVEAIDSPLAADLKYRVQA